MDSKRKMWVKEASLKKMSMFYKDKKEDAGNMFLNTRWICADIEAIEKSGLTEIESEYLEKWLALKLSGRHCMIALLESRKPTIQYGEKSGTNPLTLGVISRPIEFTMLGTSLSLPDDFLCDSGYLFEKIFRFAPQQCSK